jgi:hypothetical protein
MSRKPLQKRLSVLEDIKLIREKNKLRKQELLNILHIEDNNYTLYELEQKLSAKLYIEKREKNRVNMLYSLGLDKNTQIDYNELVNLHQEKEKEEERLYQERLSLRERLKKQTDEFNISQYRKKYPENNIIITEHFTSYTPSFHNPGGATIYTQANAANSMVFNQESGIYAPCDF